MSALSPEAQALLALTRSAEGPSAKDYARMRARVLPALAAGCAVASATLSHASMGAATRAVAAPSLPGATAPAPLAGAVAPSAAGVASAVPIAGFKLSMGQFLLWMALGAGAGSAGIAATMDLSSPYGHRSSPNTAVAAPGSVPRPAKPKTGANGLEAAPGMAIPLGTTPTGAGQQAGLGSQAVAKRLSQPQRNARSAAGERARAMTNGETSKAQSRRVPDTTLAEETRLLQRAQAARREGRVAEAVELLGEHQRRFPQGTLRIERDVARVLALCAAGKAEASNRLRNRVLFEAPDLPATSSVRTPCSSHEP